MFSLSLFNVIIYFNVFRNSSFESSEWSCRHRRDFSSLVHYSFCRLLAHLKWMLRPEHQNLNFCNHALNKGTKSTFSALHFVCNSATHFLRNTTHCFLHIRHFTQEWNLLQSLGKHFYRNCKTHLKLATPTHTYENTNWTQISLSLSTTNRPQVSSPLLWELCTHGGSERKRKRSFPHFLARDDITCVDEVMWPDLHRRQDP